MCYNIWIHYWQSIRENVELQASTEKWLEIKICAQKTLHVLQFQFRAKILLTSLLANTRTSLIRVFLQTPVPPTTAFYRCLTVVVCKISLLTHALGLKAEKMQPLGQARAHDDRLPVPCIKNVISF